MRRRFPSLFFFFIFRLVHWIGEIYKMIKLWNIYTYSFVSQNRVNFSFSSRRKEVFLSENRQLPKVEKSAGVRVRFENGFIYIYIYSVHRLTAPRKWTGRKKRDRTAQVFQVNLTHVVQLVSVRFYIEISLGTLLDWTIWHESEKAFAYVSSNMPSAEFQLIVATRL